MTATKNTEEANIHTQIRMFIMAIGKMECDMGRENIPTKKMKECK